ncbi:MAG TPA: nuclear transport factor 2 family protein [Gaiellaceae bacterium]|nr:nuclear transport factor 2 family protein [Gaiellaceae bacterium]
MNGPTAVVEEAYRLAKRADHRSLRQLIADDATWHPAREGAWNPCRDADTIVRTLLWRCGPANRFRPGETIELGNQVLIQLRGTRMRRLGAKGFRGKLSQIVEVRDGKIVRMQDYQGPEEALAATGREP